VIETPLWNTAIKGPEGVVKLFLKYQGVEPDRHDKYGVKPPPHAAMRAHGGIVKPVFLDVRSVRLQGKTGRTSADSQSFWRCHEGLPPGMGEPDGQ